MKAVPLVLVTVGSDHHPFDRLVRWVDAWVATASGDFRCVVQYGTSTPPRHAEGHDFLPHDQLQALMRDATVIVTQGGPMSVVEARQAGSVPITVPRTSALGEHVDDHQHAFCGRLAEEGLLHLPADEADLHRLIDAGLDDPERFAAASDTEAIERVRTTTARFATLVDQLVRPRTEQPRVLLIAGSGRSGSTLFERMLGSVDGVTPLGETVHLWERGVRDDELCSCREPFSTCPFWSAVGREAFGGWDQLDVHEIVTLRNAVVRTRHVPALLASSPSSGWRLRRDHLARLVGALYRGVQVVSGARLLVDSSKLVAYAALLRHAGVDLHCVEVVRDPRGVAYSLGKSVPRPEALDDDEMHRQSPVESSLWWTAFDVLFRAMAVRGTPVSTVRYEDFIADPRAEVRDGFSGGPASTSPTAT